MPKGKNIFQKFAARLTWWQSTVAALIVVVGAAFTVNAHFAKEADLTALAADVSQGRLKSDKRQLRQEQTQLESIPERERRRRTPFEEQRLKEVELELKDVDRELEQRRRK